MKHVQTSIRTMALLVSLAASSWAQMPQQLYVVTGYATPKDTAPVPSAVFSVHETSQVLSRVADLVDDTQGSDFILVDHEQRTLVIGTPNGSPKRVIVLSMDAPTAPRSVALTYEGIMVEPYLLTGPDGRLIQALYTARAEQRKLLGFDFTGAPRAELAWQDLRRVRTEGFWSPGDMPTRLQVTIKDGKLLLHPGFANADLGISVPPSMMPQAGESYFFLAVNNADLLVVDRYRDHPVGEGAVQVLSVYEKASGEWHNVTFPAAGAAVRGFGAWLASTRTERKRANTGTATIQVDPGNEKESPGSVFRKNVLNDHARTSEQISVNGLFFQAPYYFAGELLLYNAHSRQKYTIETGQGDSEILLVSDGAVYYRVNDTLYKATIGKTSIENPVKLLQDDQIQFAHWAFFGPPVPQQ